MKIFTVKILFYLITGKVDRHIEEKSGSKHLAFDSTDEKKEVIKMCKEFWKWVKNEIETINGGKRGEHGKDFMKIKFDTGDSLLLNKLLKLHLLTIIARSIFQEDGKLYAHLYLEDRLYEL